MPLRGVFFEISNNWRASEASETVLRVDDAKSGICYIYVFMNGMYAP